MPPQRDDPEDGLKKKQQQQQRSTPPPAPSTPPPSSAKQQQQQQQQQQQPAAAKQQQHEQQHAARPPLTRGSQVVVMILGGGAGDALQPLTARRAEPAVPFANYRLIDIPISNAIHSGLDSIYILAQYNATSLSRHCARAFGFLSADPFGQSARAFVEVVHATQRPGDGGGGGGGGSGGGGGWYRGTADAVRAHLDRLSIRAHEDAEDVLILAGDQLYKMDLRALVNYHRASGADVTVATTPADAGHAERLGVLKLGPGMRVRRVVEKPPAAALAELSMDADCHGPFGLCEAEALERPFVASMGIYVVKKQFLIDVLGKRLPDAADFARDVLPALLREGEGSSGSDGSGSYGSLGSGDEDANGSSGTGSGTAARIIAYPFTSYWEDVGSLGAYYEAHMALARGALNNKLRLFDKDRPILTEPRTLPPTKVTESTIEHTLLGDGCRVVGATLRGCVLGSAAYVDRGAVLEGAVVFGADEFQTPAGRAADLAAGLVPLGIGAGAALRRAIVDRNARVGRGARLVNVSGVREAGAGTGGLPEGVVIREGVVVVTRGAVVPDGTVV